MLGQAAEGLFHFYDMRSWFREGALAFAEARLALERQQNDPTTLLGKLLAREGWFVFHEGRQTEAQTLLERSQTLLRALDARSRPDLFAQLPWRRMRLPGRVHANAGAVPRRCSRSRRS